MRLFDWFRGRPADKPDDELVGEAVDLISRRQFDRAEQLLRAVLDRAPAGYVNQEEVDGKLHVRFWDMPEFLAYVAWMQEEGTSRDVVWVPNAYPRAAYYLGYIAIERGAFEAAVAVLDHGLRLQPDSGKLAHEKAQALLRAGRLDEAGAVYREVLGRPGFLPPADRAALLRGRGYLEIERHDLDAAERTFREALALEPDSPVARNELEYIAVLRGG